MSNELPKGWIITTLAEILVTLESGSRPRGGVRGISEGIPSIGGEHLNYDGTFNFTSVKYVPSKFAERMTKGLIHQNDILVVKDGATTGKTVFVDNCFSFSKAVVNEHVFICRPSMEIDARFLFRYLMSKRGQDRILANFKGSAQGGINQTFPPNTDVPLPPQNEQQRILVKMEKLLAKVAACQRRLAKIPILLKRFRQSVLAAACSGRLTADWRNRNKAYGISLNGDLPTGWRWIKLEKLLLSRGIFDGPFGSNLKTIDYVNDGIRVIRLENIGHLRFIHVKESYISHEKYQTLKKHTVGAGDIIFASFIDEEVRACVLPEIPTKAIAKADCFCLRPREELVDRHYLTFQIVSRESYNVLSENVHGATRPRINTTQLRKLEIPVPPLSEQQEIVRQAGGLFALADQIAARFGKARASIDKLTQSILAKAFRGELVPQDPNDEPATELLRRIREERSKKVPENKGKLPKSKK